MDYQAGSRKNQHIPEYVWASLEVKIKGGSIKPTAWENRERCENYLAKIWEKEKNSTWECE